MNYGPCQRYLQEILDSGVKFGLDNVRTVLTALGQPQLAYPAILVAGTNGKGSVCAMLTTALSRQGFRAGLYTSPHLVRVEERIRIGETPISRRVFCRLLGRLKAVIRGLIDAGKLAASPTYFEILTLLAFLYFQERKIDIAVLEVGMGGRLDATNVVTPLVSVITTVDDDHQEFLGRTRREIASEKAGIIKPGVPVVCGVVRGAVRGVIRRKAREQGAPFYGVFDDPRAFRSQRTKNGFHFSFHWEGEKYIFSPALLGEYQGRNAAVSIAALREIGRRWRPIQKRVIVQSIRKTRWEGRLESVPGRPRVVLDGAHNESGARAVGAYVRDFLPRPVTLVFGIMKDKSIRKVAGLLFPLARTIILTSVPIARAASPEMIFSLAPVQGKRTFLEPDPKKAVKKAIELTPLRGSILITGSLFLVGEVKKHFPFRPKR
ncbi:MAG TPA: folylpolyglutamate synthase/dihydrofolate synthase family protein [Candidatus Desulfaltia sp.]|nr:folylpolyglutamate synthase/dihydrofolate synthase family protein [Candidatus Desulfaltia sp.]